MSNNTTITQGGNLRLGLCYQFCLWCAEASSSYKGSVLQKASQNISTPAWTRYFGFPSSGEPKGRRNDLPTAPLVISPSDPTSLLLNNTWVHHCPGSSGSGMAKCRTGQDISGHLGDQHHFTSLSWGVKAKHQPTSSSAGLSSPPCPYGCLSSSLSQILAHCIILHLRNAGFICHLVQDQIIF